MSTTDSKKNAKKAHCPVASTLKIANEQAKSNLGTPAGDKSVSATSDLSVSVTENGKKNTNTTHSTVSVSVASKCEDAPASSCCAGNCCAGSSCCK